MDPERARNFMLTLPYVVETQQWGDNLVFWVGDKAIGGKMFCLLNLGEDAQGAVSYLVGAERFHELLERDGVKPAPYFARIFWVAAESWGVFKNAEWESELRAAHEMTFEKLPKKVKDVLAMPAKEREKLVAARRKALAGKKKEK